MAKLQSNPSLTEPFGVEIDLTTGAMPNATNHLVRHASDMRGYYADEDALETIIRREDPVHYEVFEKPVPEEDGHLMFCISVLQPGLVGEECFITKGHYHTKPHTAETYLCLRGTGYMAMKTPEGQWRAERMQRGRMVYVPPFWAHRSVNTGDEPLVSHCVYPADAGHNYGDIATEGFPKRVFKRSGQEVIA
ncbi:MAG: glucose-6-phosphate isomerase family protein [Planctomycetota bacterium]